MLDATTRRLVRPPLERLAAGVERLGIGPGAVTAVGLLVGLGACAAAASSIWVPALGLWLLNRALDGLDGAVARRTTPSDLGGMLDFLADFVVYGGFILAVAIAEPHARVAASALLVAYLLNNVALLSFAALIEKRRLGLGDERSLRFTAGLTEGTETIAAYIALCLLPRSATTILWLFTALVLVTVGQRVRLAVLTLT
ncbi:MAG: CDP-alcohol phosphatidyltransferase family protein [Candidatus Dormibacteria bacterium]